MRKLVLFILECITFATYTYGGINDCGCASVKETGRIVKGFYPNQNSIPYQVFIKIIHEQSSSHSCGGTILNSRYILTAAHCVYHDRKKTSYSPDQIKVYAGLHNICGKRGIRNLPNLEVSMVIVHSGYSAYGNWHKDIALLKLKASLKPLFSATIMPACLPTNPKELYRGITGLASGWGTTKAYKHNQNPPKQRNQCKLKATNLKILDSRDYKCRGWTNNIADYSKLCAFMRGTATCQGDSGGPLTVNQRGKHVVVGITSYGAGCADKYPEVFTRVTEFVEWIRNNIKDGDCKN